MSDALEIKIKINLLINGPDSSKKEQMLQKKSVLMSYVYVVMTSSIIIFITEIQSE